MKSTVLAAALVAAFMVVSASSADAHEGATGIVKERMKSMEDLGKLMKSFSRIIKGREKYDAGKLLDIAVRLKLHGGDNLTQLFPGGSLMKPSNAISKIWQDWDRFSSLAETLRLEAKQLEKDLSSESNSSSQESSIATKQSFKKIARTCSNCHRDFRKKKNE